MARSLTRSICPACASAGTLVIKTETTATWICTACGWTSDLPKRTT